MERLKLVGHIQPKNSKEIKSSRIGVGFEKLDRGLFDPEKAYDRVMELGIKWVRIQSGWARTETEKGVYHFEWLDDIVDNLVSRGLQPWLSFSYGNGLYNEEAAKRFGAVGVPPINDKEYADAWDAYVEAAVKHYHGRITHYEIWNEPDLGYSWNGEPNATELGLFNERTAKIIRKADPEAKIIGGALCTRNITFADEALATGMGAAIDAISFHEYTPDETKVPETVNYLKAVGGLYNPNMAVVQGESGSQSRSDGSGALRGCSWTPLKQTKQLLRHTVIDLSTDVWFTSYFSCMDMVEALQGRVGETASYLDYGYFGVLGADFDENGRSVGSYTPKPSYYALQNLASIFHGNAKKTILPVVREAYESWRVYGRDSEDKTIISKGFTLDDGTKLYAYWNAVNLLSATCEATISLRVSGLEGTPRIIDPMTGNIYEIPERDNEKSTGIMEVLGDKRYLFKNLPLLDYPLFLAFIKD